METSPVIIAALSDFSGGYAPHTPVLKSISLSLAAGTLTAVVGPNGAGKSTLLRAFRNQLPHTHGAATLCSRPLASFSTRHLAQHVAAASTIPHDYPDTALAYTLLGRTPHRNILSLNDSNTDTQIALDALNLMGIPHLAHRPVAQLSDGQRQMVCLARAIAQRPRLLLLDEPTANLDPANSQRILLKIKDITRSQGIAALTTIHDINAALQWADNVLLLKDGTTIAFGPAPDVLTPHNLSLAFSVPFSLQTALIPSPAN